jgi:hypothetical protein
LSQKLIAIVEAVKATRRIKPEHRGEFNATFFSRLDFWTYHAVFDTKLCDRCAEHAKTKMFAGSDLRRIFPNLEIIDVNIIAANVHPNCRCFLMRQLF